MHNITFPLSSVAQSLAKRLPFNADTDFAGVSIAVYVPFVIMSHPSVPAKDLRELGRFCAATRICSTTTARRDPGLGDARDRRDLQARAKSTWRTLHSRARPLKQEVLSGRVQSGAIRSRLRSPRSVRVR